MSYENSNIETEEEDALEVETGISSSEDAEKETREEEIGNILED